MSITKSRDAAIGTVKPLDNYSRGVVYIQTGLESGRVQTPTRSRSAVRIDLRRPFRSASKNITLPGRTMSVDNLAGAQRSTLSTAEPDNPLVTRGSLRGEQQPKGTERSTTNLKHVTIHRTGVTSPSRPVCSRALLDSWDGLAVRAVRVAPFWSSAGDEILITHRFVGDGQLEHAVKLGTRAAECGRAALCVSRCPDLEVVYDIQGLCGVNRRAALHTISLRSNHRL